MRESKIGLTHGGFGTHSAHRLLCSLQARHYRSSPAPARHIETRLQQVQNWNLAFSARSKCAACSPWSLLAPALLLRALLGLLPLRNINAQRNINEMRARKRRCCSLVNELRKRGAAALTGSPHPCTRSSKRDIPVVAVASSIYSSSSSSSSSSGGST
jgi:hypothetical protein